MVIQEFMTIVFVVACPREAGVDDDEDFYIAPEDDLMYPWDAWEFLVGRGPAWDWDED